jgi:hypothetical protein
MLVEPKLNATWHGPTLCTTQFEITKIDISYTLKLSLSTSFLCFNTLEKVAFVNDKLTQKRQPSRINYLNTRRFVTT